MSDVLIIDARNGATSTRAMTPAEVAEAAARGVAAASSRQAEATTTGNRTTIEQRLVADLTAMQAIIDVDPTTILVTTLPQAQAAARDAVRRDKDIARAIRHLARHVLRSFDAVD